MSNVHASYVGGLKGILSTVGPFGSVGMLHGIPPFGYFAHEKEHISLDLFGEITLAGGHENKNSPPAGLKEEWLGA